MEHCPVRWAAWWFSLDVSLHIYGLCAPTESRNHDVPGTQLMDTLGEFTTGRESRLSHIVPLIFMVNRGNYGVFWIPYPLRSI